MPKSLSDFEIEVGKHPLKDRKRLVMKLSPAAYQCYVLLMMERHGIAPVKDCLGVPIVEDANVDGISVEWTK